MLPDRKSNPGPLTYESGALPIALRGPAPGNWKKLVKKFANMNHSIEQDLGAQGWSLQPYSSSTDAYSLCLDPVAPRLAFLKINPRATTRQMSVSPSISTLTLTSPSDSSLQITIIPVENVKKQTRDDTSETEPSKRRKVLDLPAENLHFYKESRGFLSRMVKKQ